MSSKDSFHGLELPEFSQELLSRCNEFGDYLPIAFEWYKYAGLLTAQFMQAARESPAFREISPLHFGTLVGSLNRCSRLMLANLRLGNDGKHGESTRILDRCIVETATKVIWLCQGAGAERFERFLADGLKRDLEFKALILKEIRERGNGEMVIERRMLGSIDHAITSAGLTEQAVEDAKKLPDMASLLMATGHGRLAYVAAERMGSHAVHGSWTALLANYLEIEGEEFLPRDNDVPMDLNQFVAVPLFVLDALEAFIGFACKQESDADTLAKPIRFAREEILKMFGSATKSDFDPA